MLTHAALQVSDLALDLISNRIRLGFGELERGGEGEKV